jgi:hypothetical protein
MAGLPESIHKLINEALEIEAEQAKAAGSLGFMCRSMVQASLPSRRVDGVEFVRSNGNFTLSLMSPSKIGLPYGTIPRLMLSWLATEAVRTQERELVLGDSLSGFMRQLPRDRRARRSWPGGYRSMALSAKTPCSRSCLSAPASRSTVKPRCAPSVGFFC